MSATGRVLILLTLSGWLVSGRLVATDSPCSSVEKVRRLEETIRTLAPSDPEAKEHVDSLTAVVASSDCSKVLRQRAGLLLGRIGRPAAKAVPVLEELLDGPERYWAMKSLGLFGEVASEAVKRLSAELRDESRGLEDRILIADVLGQIRTGLAIEAIGRELLRGNARSSTEDTV